MKAGEVHTGHEDLKGGEVLATSILGVVVNHLLDLVVDHKVDRRIRHQHQRGTYAVRQRELWKKKSKSEHNKRE
jgi:hypothetical protein